MSLKQPVPDQFSLLFEHFWLVYDILGVLKKFTVEFFCFYMGGSFSHSICLQIYDLICKVTFWHLLLTADVECSLER